MRAEGRVSPLTPPQSRPHNQDGSFDLTHTIPGGASRGGAIGRIAALECARAKDSYRCVADRRRNELSGRFGSKAVSGHLKTACTTALRKPPCGGSQRARELTVTRSVRRPCAPGGAQCTGSRAGPVPGSHAGSCLRMRCGTGHGVAARGSPGPQNRPGWRATPGAAR